MQVVSSSDELREFVDGAGRLECPVVLAPGFVYKGLGFLTCADGLTVSEGCALEGLCNLKSLSGVVLERRCCLYGLHTVISLDGVVLEEFCQLYELSSLKSLKGLTMMPGSGLIGADNALDAASVAADAVIPLNPRCSQVLVSSWPTSIEALFQDGDSTIYLSSVASSGYCFQD